MDEENFQSNESFIIVPSQVTIKDLCNVFMGITPYNLYSVWNKIIKSESYPSKKCLISVISGSELMFREIGSKTEKLLMRTGSIYLKVTNSKSKL